MAERLAGGSSAANARIPRASSRSPTHDATASKAVPTDQPEADIEILETRCAQVSEREVAQPVSLSLRIHLSARARSHWRRLMLVGIAHDLLSRQPRASRP
jgi:hypothetical protein